MRLIDADKAIEIWKDKDYIKFLNQEEKAKMLLDLIPTEHPQRKTGKWIEDIDYLDGINFPNIQFKCSECHNVLITKSNYCPNCGAEMNGGEEDDRTDR